MLNLDMRSLNSDLRFGTAFPEVKKTWRIENKAGRFWCCNNLQGTHKDYSNMRLNTQLYVCLVREYFNMVKKSCFCIIPTPIKFLCFLFNRLIK